MFDVRFVSCAAPSEPDLDTPLLVDALVTQPGYAAVFLAARPGSDPVPALRAAAAGVRLPGSS